LIVGVIIKIGGEAVIVLLVEVDTLALQKRFYLLSNCVFRERLSVFGDELSCLREFHEFPLDLLCFYELTLVLEVGHAFEVVGRALAVLPGFFLILCPQVVLEIRQFGRES
jgi:hypothetical protein